VPKARCREAPQCSRSGTRALPVRRIWRFSSAEGKLRANRFHVDGGQRCFGDATSAEGGTMRLLIPYDRRPNRFELIAVFVCVGVTRFLLPTAVGAQPQVAEKQPYKHLLQFITIPTSELPKSIRIKEIKESGAPIIPLRNNPEVFVDPKAFRLIAKFFQIEGRELERVSASVVAIYYQETETRNEIGIYGIYFSDQKSADEHIKKLLRATKERAKNQRGFPFIQKGRLLLYVWKDDGVSNLAFEQVVEYFRTKKFEVADRR
jgi:hypothetical protein